MSNKLKNVGRAKQRRRNRGPNFIQLYRYVLDSPAYMSLSANARSALIEVNRGYNGANNGNIVLSLRSITERMGCHKETASIALQELVKKGFIEERVKGSYRRKFRHATEWRLTDRRCDVTGAEQSQTFLKWQNPDPEPEPKTRKPQGGNSALCSTEIPPTRNFPGPARQYGNSAHCKTKHSTEIPPTSIFTSLEGDVALPDAVLSDAAEPLAAAGIGHNNGPPMDYLDIPEFLRRN
jgi:hypothetical protein